MGEYGILLARILPSKDRIYNSVLYGRIRISENPYSRILCSVWLVSAELFFVSTEVMS